jgi:hypothetical protein
MKRALLLMSGSLLLAGCGGSGSEPEAVPSPTTEQVDPQVAEDLRVLLERTPDANEFTIEESVIDGDRLRFVVNEQRDPTPPGHFAGIVMTQMIGKPLTLEVVQNGSTLICEPEDFADDKIYLAEDAIEACDPG